MMNAIVEVMDDNQQTINEQAPGFEGLYPGGLAPRQRGLDGLAEWREAR